MTKVANATSGEARRGARPRILSWILTAIRVSMLAIIVLLGSALDAWAGTPTATGVSPTSGPTGGGTVVTITGSDFDNATAVVFGSAQGTSLSIVTDTLLKVTTPSGSPGAVPVTVTTTDGSADAPNDFTYQAAPTVSTLSINRGPTSGGTIVTITGTGFTGVTNVSIGGVAAATVFDSATTITAQTAAHAAGVVDVSVTTPGGTGTLPDAFTYTSPVVITTGSPSGTTVGSAYSQLNTAAGGTGTLTFALATGALPTGTSLNPTTGVVTGTLTAAGTFTYVIKVTDGANDTATGSTVSVTVGAPPLALSPASGTTLASATAGTAYTATLSVSGGVGASTWSASGLPAGLAINPSSGAISGTPTTAGTSTLTVNVTNADGATASATYTLVVEPSAPVGTSQSVTVAANSTADVITPSLSGGGITALRIVAAPLHGTATINGTSIDYSPTAGYSGADSLEYSASNVSGTTQATVHIEVAAPTLVVTPAAGSTLATASVGAAWSQALTVSGGASPYAWSASGLPAGLAINASTGTLSGTPTKNGSTTFSVLVTDADGVQLTASYTLTVNGTVPVAQDRTVSLYAGQTVNVSLTDGTNGGPFTGAALTSAPASAQGTAKITGSAGSYSLNFAAAPRASGAVVLHYTLTNAWGTSNAATLTLEVNTRPDPSTDPDVTGLLEAQAQSAEEFANAQIGNFNDRLEQLHDDRTRTAQTFNIQVNAPQTPDAATGGTPSTGALQPGVAAKSGGTADATSASGSKFDDPVETLAKRLIGNDNLVFWSGGFVDFGSTDRSEIQFSHTLVGLSAGADYRFMPSLAAGLGFGYGRDVQDVGNDGTQSKGQAGSAALYGSFHPGATFVDALLGYSDLSFDTPRYVTETGDYANGNQAGDQVFGSLSSGYEFRTAQSLVSPYGRLQFSSTLLRHFTETGAGAFDLSYADEHLNMLSAVAGLRGQYGIPMSWGAIKLTGRFEYSHQLNGNSEARLGYADLSDDSYTVTVLGLSENTMTASAGLDFALPGGLTTGIAYQGTFSVSDHSRENEILLHVAVSF